MIVSALGRPCLFTSESKDCKCDPLPLLSDPTWQTPCGFTQDVVLGISTGKLFAADIILADMHCHLTVSCCTATTMQVDGLIHLLLHYGWVWPMHRISVSSVHNICSLISELHASLKQGLCKLLGRDLSFRLL